MDRTSKARSLHQNLGFLISSYGSCMQLIDSNDYEKHFFDDIKITVIQKNEASIDDTAKGGLTQFKELFYRDSLCSQRF